jgi:hypothetical protein
LTTLLDVTVSHTGWKGGTFAAGGWEDFFPLTVSGIPAASFWSQSVNGAAFDMAAAFGTNPPFPTHPYWLNVHGNGIHDGPTVPSPYLVPANEGVYVYTRTPSATGSIQWRLIVSDQAVTPPPSALPCAYGTRTQSGFPSGVILTANLIGDVLAFFGLQVLGPAFGALVGTSVAISELCSAQPPVFPELSANFLLNSPAELLQAFRSVSWRYFCECIPGTPAPVPYPPPTFTPPPGWPAAPTFPCDPANLCASIARIETLLNQVAGNVASSYALTTLLQRYSLPFGVIPGQFHIGVTGEGSIFVNRLIGLEYDVAQMPSSVKVVPGVTPYIRDLGWVGFTLPSGAVVEHRVTRQQELWMPDEAQLATQLGWSLTPGTSINIRELQAEP